MVSETESAYYSYCKYISIVKYCGIQYIYYTTIHSIVGIIYQRWWKSRLLFSYIQEKYIYIMVWINKVIWRRQLCMKYGDTILQG